MNKERRKEKKTAIKLSMDSRHQRKIFTSTHGSLSWLGLSNKTKKLGLGDKIQEVH